MNHINSKIAIFHDFVVFLQFLFSKAQISTPKIRHRHRCTRQCDVRVKANGNSNLNIKIYLIRRKNNKNKKVY